MDSLASALRIVAVVFVLSLGAACAPDALPPERPADAAPTSVEPSEFAPGFYPTPNADPPLIDGDPGTAVATKVRDEHRVTLLATPGYLGTTISRHDGRTVIVVFTDEPVPKPDRIKKLDGIPIFYSLGGQLITEPPGV